MTRATPLDNLYYLMSNISIASWEQLAHFFRDIVGENASIIIENEVRHHKLVRPKNDGLDENPTSYFLQKHLAKPVPKRQAYDYIKAFWVIADFGSSNISYVTNGMFPVQYVFADNADRNYDITVIDNINVAELSRLNRLRQIVIGYEDNMYHIAVINDKNMIPKLKQLGFDFFYTVDVIKQKVTQIG